MTLCYVNALAGLLSVSVVGWFLLACSRAFDADHARVSRG